jgi:hypothetical protein
MKRLREIINTGRLVPLIVLFLSLCVLDNMLAATPSDEMRVTLLVRELPFRMLSESAQPFLSKWPTRDCCLTVAAAS